MNYYPFNSRNSIYRNIIGAIASNQKLTLRLLLHNDALVHNAYLTVKDDNGTVLECELTPKEWCEDYRFYDTEIELPVGLYWYSFHYKSEYGDFYIVKDKDSNGIVSKNSGEMWQQTVYSADFIAPKRYEGGIIYQIFPDRFYSSHKEKVNVPDDRYMQNDWSHIPAYLQNGEKYSLGNDYYGGDLLGIKEKLPYLKELGVSIIYLNPIFEAHSNHRYNTADYMKIDPLLGSEADFVSLCKAAKKQGISVIFDGVFSHTGDDSIYFNKYRRYGDGGAYNDPNSPYFGWYKFGQNRDDYTSWWGVKTLPEVNETNEGFSEFITGKKGVIAHWLNCGADGVRLDVADELPDEFIKDIRKCVKSAKPDAFLLGEVWEDASNKISYDKRREFLLGNELDSVMNYPLCDAIIDFVLSGNAQQISDTVWMLCENYPKPVLNLLMNHIGTHDTARILTVLSKGGRDFPDRNAQADLTVSGEEYNLGKRRLFAAVVLQYTLPGIPSVFYGDEAGVLGGKDPFCRAAYPWGNEDTEILSFYKAIGKLRNAALSLKNGNFEVICANDGLFSFVRKDGKNELFCAVNTTSAKALGIPSDYSYCFGKSLDGNTVSLEQYEFFVCYK